MESTKRMKLSKIINKIQKNQVYANKIGTVNKSYLKTNKK